MLPLEYLFVPSKTLNQFGSAVWPTSVNIYKYNILSK